MFPMSFRYLLVQPFVIQSFGLTLSANIRILLPSLSFERGRDMPQPCSSSSIIFSFLWPIFIFRHSSCFCNGDRYVEVAYVCEIWVIQTDFWRRVITGCFSCWGGCVLRRSFVLLVFIAVSVSPSFPLPSILPVCLFWRGASFVAL